MFVTIVTIACSYRLHIFSIFILPEHEFNYHKMMIAFVHLQKLQIASFLQSKKSTIQLSCEEARIYIKITTLTLIQ